MIEDLACLKHDIATKRMLAVIQPSGHNHDVLLFGVGPAKDLAQVVEVFRVPDGDENVARADSQSFVLRLFAAIDPELIQAFWFPGALPRHPPLRVSENCKKHQAE